MKNDFPDSNPERRRQVQRPSPILVRQNPNHLSIGKNPVEEGDLIEDQNGTRWHVHSINSLGYAVVYNDAMVQVRQCNQIHIITKHS